MNDLEDRIRDELRRHAGTDPFRPVPGGTMRRIRLRQGRTVVSTALALSLILGGALALARVVPGNGRAQPAEKGTPSIVGSPAPSPSFGPWPVVTFGGDFTPYVGDEFSGGPRTIIAYGTVDGIPWSEVADHAGRCLGLYVTTIGGTFCSDTHLPPGLGLDSFATGASGPIGYWGVLPPAATRVEVHLDNGDVRPIQIFPGPPGADGKYYVLFPPPRAPGMVVALDTEGNVLGHAPLCAWDTELSSNTSTSRLCA